MSTKPENQNVEIIPWTRDQRTRWSSTHHEELMRTSDPHHIYEYITYILWDTSTEFMATHGLPTDADVQLWIEWLESREDASLVDIQDAITQSKEYIK